MSFFAEPILTTTRVTRSTLGREAIQSLSPWLQLAKPGVTRLVLVTTYFGGIMAQSNASPLTWGLALTGTTLVVAAANALNMVAERDTDALMTRTRDRPLPTGKITAKAATTASYLAAALGLAALLALNWQTAFLGLLALAMYVWAYTPLKRVTPWALYVGALPGAAPPVLGYSAISGGQLDSTALVLFLILAVWQIPHFLAISMFRRAEYERAGIQVFSVCRSPRAVRRLMLGWSLALFAVSLLPVATGMAGTVYLAIAVGFGLPFVAGALYGLKTNADDQWARSLFFASMPHLVTLFIGLAL